MWMGGGEVDVNFRRKIYMNQYVGATIVNIRRRRGGGERSRYVYAELRSVTGELLISATLDYIVAALQERLPQMNDLDTQEMEVHAGETITKACQRLVAQAPAWMNFNGVRVEARGDETPSDLEAEWRRGMDAASAESERKRRELEATPEGQRQVTEAKRRDNEEKHLQSETVCAIDVAGLRERYPWRDGMREISGFGGAYEAACRTMMYAGLLWLQSNPKTEARTTNRDAFEKAILRAEPGCSGAMFGAAANHALFIHEKGYEEWSRQMAVSETSPETNCDQK
jgi:hypothetical protein